MKTTVCAEYVHILGNESKSLAQSYINLSNAHIDNLIMDCVGENSCSNSNLKLNNNIDCLVQNWYSKLHRDSNRDSLYIFHNLDFEQHCRIDFRMHVLDK